MQQKSFNIIGLAVALLVLVLLVAMLLPALLASKRTERRMASSNPLRGIHQGLVTYANSNKSWFPGIDPDGQDADLSIENRFQILIEHDMFTPEYAISPSENERKAAWDPENGEPISKDNYSYAMLQIPEKESGRRSEWRQSLNSQAIVVSDRNTGSSSRPRSIHYEPGDKFWSGSVLWNDNHVEFGKDGCVFETKYGGGSANTSDHLYLAVTLDDALLIHAGN